MTDITARPSEERAPVTVNRSATTDIALVGTFAALIAVCSLTAVTFSVVPVPITLQTFAVLLTGAVLGARRGSLAVLLFLAVGAAGLPVFAAGKGGPGVFAAPSAGYLLAFPLAAFVIGLLAQHALHRSSARRAVLLTTGVVGASLLIYAVGIPVLAARAGMTLGEAVVFNNAFIPFDAVKAALAVVVALAVHRAFPDLLARRPRGARRSRPVPVGQRASAATDVDAG